VVTSAQTRLEAYDRACRAAQSSDMRGLRGGPSYLSPAQVEAMFSPMQMHFLFEGPGLLFRGLDCASMYATERR
jgi:hypothetical protein